MTLQEEIIAFEYRQLAIMKQKIKEKYPILGHVVAATGRLEQECGKIHLLLNTACKDHVSEEELEQLVVSWIGEEAYSEKQRMALKNFVTEHVSFYHSLSLQDTSTLEEAVRKQFATPDCFVEAYDKVTAAAAVYVDEKTKKHPIRWFVDTLSLTKEVSKEVRDEFVKKVYGSNRIL